MNGKNQKRGYLSSLIGEKTPSKIAGLTYSAAVCVFLAVSFVVALFAGEIGETKPQWYLYLSFLAAPIAFALTVAWYFSYTKTSVKAFVKEQKCSPKYYLVAALLQIGLFSLGELNGLFLQFLENFGYQNIEIELPSTAGFGIVGVLLAVAVLPAVMEELFFRGIFLRETKEFSLLGRVLLCGGLFALYHQNPAQTIYQFICGAAFAYVAAKAGSFLPTVLSHFINNALIVVLYANGITAFEGGTYAFILVLSAICLVGTLVYFLFFDKKNEEKKSARKGVYKEFFTCAALGITVLGLTWLLALIGGF